MEGGEEKDALCVRLRCTERRRTRVSARACWAGQSERGLEVCDSSETEGGLECSNERAERS